MLTQRIHATRARINTPSIYAVPNKGRMRIFDLVGRKGAPINSTPRRSWARFIGMNDLLMQGQIEKVPQKFS